jgi:hypothetical protein
MNEEHLDDYLLEEQDNIRKKDESLNCWALSNAIKKLELAEFLPKDEKGNVVLYKNKNLAWEQIRRAIVKARASGRRIDKSDIDDIVVPYGFEV